MLTTATEAPVMSVHLRGVIPFGMKESPFPRARTMGVKTMMPRALPTQKSRMVMGMVSCFSDPMATRVAVQRSALRNGPTVAPTVIRFLMSRRSPMRGENLRRRISRNHPRSDSIVLPSDPAMEKVRLLPKVWVAAMVPNVIAGNRRHPRSRSRARASPLEGQRGADGVSETL